MGNMKLEDNPNSFINVKRSVSDMERMIKAGFRQDDDQLPPPTRPLQIRKQSSEMKFAPSQDLKDNNPYKHSSNPRYPPRTSSMNRALNVFPFGQDQPEIMLQTPGSTTSHWTDERISDTGSEGGRSTKSTISDIKDLYVSSPSSEIMGNFVPISPSRHVSASTEAMFFAPVSTDPYEFEPDTPYIPMHSRPVTTFSNFIDPASMAMRDSQVPRPLHTKNARSESQSLPFHKPAGKNSNPPKGFGHAIQRSESSPSLNPSRFTERYPERRESSPNLTPSKFAERFLEKRRESSPNIAPHLGGRFPDRHSRAASPELRRCRGDSSVPSRRGRTPERPKQRALRQEDATLSSNNFQDYKYGCSTAGVDSRVPPRSSHRVSDNSRQGARSPTKTLQNLVERDENVTDSPVPPSVAELKQRSRSPMKKMFGENGWLGKTPNEINEINHYQKRSPASKEKTSMMGRLKNKLGEMAERAELNSSRCSRVSMDRPPPKMSVLSVSLSAPEQAKIYMELELMVIITANTFLMSQFSQGRIAVDTIKKIVDVWKSKGRPVVIEFMYDQGTQRDLVALNQHNFRFYGDRSGDAMRINSMLYNWKSIASLMAVRTLCNADTVILKLLFDIEQVLELLGAREPIMMRLQQIRSTANETMRLERLRRSGNSIPQDVAPGHDTWTSRSSTDGNITSRTVSMDDPYGGMKLVPDSYVE